MGVTRSFYLSDDALNNLIKLSEKAGRNPNAYLNLILTGKEQLNITPKKNNNVGSKKREEQSSDEELRDSFNKLRKFGTI